MPGKGSDAEAMRQFFGDGRIWVGLGLVKSSEIAPDRSEIFIDVEMFPDAREVTCRTSWSSTGPNSGIFQSLRENDLVVVVWPDGDEDLPIIISRLTSKDDQIPIQAIDGRTVVSAINGKPAHIMSTSKVLLGRKGDDPTEPIILGAVFQGAYSSHLSEGIEQANVSSTHDHIGNMGFNTAPPNQATDFTAVATNLQAILDSPVLDDAMLSDLSFTEK